MQEMGSVEAESHSLFWQQRLTCYTLTKHQSEDISICIEHLEIGIVTKKLFMPRARSLMGKKPP